MDHSGAYILLLLSHILDTGILLGSAFAKVPQIVKMGRARSGEGISLVASLLEFTCVSFTTAYCYDKRFAFGTYGESLFISVQNLIIVCMLLCMDRKQPKAAFVLCTAVGAYAAAVFAEVVPTMLLTVMYSINIPVVFCARGVQIAENYKNSSTGQLSAITVSMYLCGSVARIFTSVQETGDSLKICTYSLASVMNGIMVGQVFIYWGKGSLPR